MLTYPIHTTHTPSQLVALIATHHPDWQVCFLNNNHRPVIGIRPVISWIATFTDTLLIDRQARHTKSQRYTSTYTDWQNELIAYCQNQTITPTHQGDYTHGLMGFIGYDLSAHELNADIAIKPNQPCAYFGHYDIYLKPCEYGFSLIGMNDDVYIFDEVKATLNDLLNQKLPQPTSAQFVPSWKKVDYAHAFNQVQEYIKAGDTYQINLTQSWQADLTDLASFLPILGRTMNAPFAGYLSLNGFELLSVSPELFFEFYQKNNHIHLTTKPIKGTRPRHSDPMLDDELKNELANSEKDISENLMIVDLLRNDLGKYAHIGTVKTPKRFAIESFQNVHHMVSTITAQLNHTHSLEVLFGSLPAGSITGTPKKRACEIIHELEVSPRGAYCGTMGYLNFDGSGVWNVLIRTLQQSNKCELWAGGGITIKSDMADEYQECTDKVGAIIRLMAQS
ncbi:anthranilate synthase component I family protein [Moraxella haemolytica]|uniref:anthranilate synthase component I family protein n=1 Tax=Moraxella TaxID=475 RepID=UPI0025434663|nr:anthranilate synthase component I family protein [Moraxella sp. ZY171148]WII95051.1 anthranilate synthase component I family protein [Moraxella sp. ZY171148]